MRNFITIKGFLFCLCLFASLFSIQSNAQVTPCDTCTGAWGPVTQKVYYSQTVPGMLPSCLYNVHLSIQTRICNGKVEVRLIDQYIEPLSSSSSCQLYCLNVGYLMQKISKLLLVDLGGNIILSKPSACYYLLEFELSPGLKSCLGKEAGYFLHWYSAIPCDANGCCVTEYVLQADGSVRTVTSASLPCVAPPPSPVPPAITVYCWSMGVRTAYTVNVILPTTPLTCEVACTTTGYIFTAKTTGISEQENANQNAVVYPNPATDEINISENAVWKKVSIIDMQGKIIESYSSPKRTISIKKLLPGNYLILLEDLRGNKEKHLISKQ